MKYNVPLVKLTGGQRIDLVGIPKADLPGVWQDLDMPAGTAWGKSYRTCKSCIGTEFCRFGLGDSMGLATKIERRFRGIDSPAKMKLATAGCPRNCSEAYVKDVGLVAIGEGKWEIYVGGAAGAHIRKGDLLCVVEGEDEAITISGRFMQYYRENAKWKERTYTFVPRIGLERIRAVVVDDCRRDRGGVGRGNEGQHGRRLRSVEGGGEAAHGQPVRGGGRMSDVMLDHRVGALDAIPRGEGRVFAVGGQRLAVFRTHADGVFATQERCPHLGRAAGGRVD